MANTRFILNTGAKIPALGLGTWQSGIGEVRAAVSHALSVGYKHIDCAYVYGNEVEVGQGLKDAFAKGIKREDIFITTKLWCTYHSRPEEALDKSLKSLGLDYVDLYLVHWPVAFNPNGNHDFLPRLPDGSFDLVKDWSHIQTWKEVEKLVKRGKVKAIGVSNYSVRYLEELLPHAKIIPAVNQIENHPSLPQQDVVDLCKAKGIHITAYSPFGSSGSPVAQEPIITELAKKKGVSPTAILLSYHVARGSSVLAKSVNLDRIKDNFDSIISLDKDDMTALNEYSTQLGKEGKLKRYVFPSFAANIGFPDKS